jgi:hypothetical protein
MVIAAGEPINYSHVIKKFSKEKRRLDITIYFNLVNSV